MNPLVSVVIPCRNSGEYIEQCIRSVRDQTYRNIEVIVVDNSDDDTPLKVSMVASEPGEIEIFYYSSELKGPSAKRNFGISKARGDLIAFLDSDDFFTSDSLEKKVARMLSDNGLGLVYSDSFVITEKDEMPKKRMTEIVGRMHDGYCLETLADNNYITTSTVLVKKKILEEAHGFDENMINSEDYDLWLRIALKGAKFGFVEEPLTYYRIRSDSLSDNSVRMNEHLIFMFNKLIAVDSSHDDKQRKILKRNLSRHTQEFYSAKCKAELLAGNVANARQEFRQLFKFRKFHPKHYFVWLMITFAPSILVNRLSKRTSHRGVEISEKG